MSSESTPPPAPSANPSPTVIHVAAGLVFRERQLLITQRFPDSHLGGLWEFPGGKVEPGESFVQCLHRELKEELDIEVRVGDLLESIEHAYPGKTVLLKFYVCRWIRHEPKAIGCSRFQWIQRNQLQKFEFPPADTRLLQQLDTPALWQ